ncbi:MAG: PP-loop domain protein, partial [Deltaproteobacteria bacterium]|nr:PP-loop domain protein [Deltaproteobacteria bacterium]
MKCKRCRRAEAAVDLPSHHAAFCPDCFFVFFRRQVKEGIRKLRLLAPEDRVLVCVSGGKDSLVLWDVLMEEGYETEGLYIDLGIDGYSDRSKERVLAYAASRGKTPIVVELAKEGIPIPETARCTRMQECSVCGTVKRHFFNRVAAEGKFTVVATGHNLDDETARLLGNLLHWQRDHLARQHPFLPGTGGGLVRKVKPLWRVSEVETAAYGFLKQGVAVPDRGEDAGHPDRLLPGVSRPVEPAAENGGGRGAGRRRFAAGRRAGGGRRAHGRRRGRNPGNAAGVRVLRRTDLRGDLFLLPVEGARAAAAGTSGRGARVTKGGRVRRGPFRAGEDILLISPKGEEHLVTLTPGKAFGTHKGNLPHDDLIGKEDGGRA